MPKTIYELELHERLNIPTDGGALNVQRVPGGWNYMYYEQRLNPRDIWEWTLVTVVFVPYNADIITIVH